MGTQPPQHMGGGPSISYRFVGIELGVFPMGSVPLPMVFFGPGPLELALWVIVLAVLAFWGGVTLTVAVETGTGWLTAYSSGSLMLFLFLFALLGLPSAVLLYCRVREGPSGCNMPFGCSRGKKKYQNCVGFPPEPI